MSPIFFTRKLYYLNRDYLFQTTYNESDRTVVCSLFNEGKLLNMHFISAPVDLRDNELVEFIVRTHDQKLNNYEILLKAAESKKGSDRIEVIFKLGSALLSKKLYDEAIELLKAASVKHNENSEIRLLLGKAYTAKNMFNDAESELLKAIEFSPAYPDYRILLGETYLNLRQPVAAIGQFKKAAELNVYYDKAYFNLGLGYILNSLVKEDFDLARDLKKNCEEAFGKAIMFNPGYAGENYDQGIKLLQEDKLEEAYEKLIPLSESRDTDMAFERLLELYIQCVSGNDGATEGIVKKYIEKIENLLKTNPGYADLENELGMAYTLMGKIMRDKAIEHFRKALDINPDFKKAIKNTKLSENELKGFEVLLEAILK